MPLLPFDAIAGEVQGNHEYEFSLFKSLADPAPTTITLDEMMGLIRSDQFKDATKQIQKEPDPSKQAQLKQSLPCVAVSGVFSGGRRVKHLASPSGLICLNFDGDVNPVLAANIMAIKSKVAKDQFSLLTFQSVRGNGLAVVSRIEDDKPYYDAYRNIAAHYENEYSLKTDESCAQVTALRFVSHDTDLRHNQHARLFKRYSLAQEPEPEPIEEAPIETPEGALPTIQGSVWVLSQEETRQPILDNVIDSGDMLDIIAPSKMRKSFFALQFGMCAASGIPFLGWDMHGKHRVIYINMEIKPAWQHRRVRAMTMNLSLSAQDLECMWYCNTRGLQLTDPMESIASTVRHIHPSVIIVDPLYMLHDGDENAAFEMKPLVREFMALMAESGAALISVHHDAKGTAGDRNIRDRGAGSGIWGRACDARITLTEHEQDPNLVCVDTMARNFPPHPGMVASFNGAFNLSDVEYSPITSSTRANKKEPVLGTPELADQAMGYFVDGPISIGVFKEDILQTRMGLSRRQATDVLSFIQTQELVEKSAQYGGGYWIGDRAQIAEKNVWIEKQKGER